MRSVRPLVRRLVRTQTVLPSLPQLLSAGLPWPARDRHDFGHPDSFGDLKRPLEGRRVQDETLHSDGRPELSACLPGRGGGSGGHSESSGLDGHSGDTGDKYGHRYAASNRLFDPLTASERSSQTTVEPMESSMRRDHLPLGMEHSTVKTDARSAEPSDVIDWDLVADDAEDVEAEGRRQTVSQIPRLGISCHAYGRRFKRMIKNGKLREALELFQNQMLQVDRVRPDAYCYNVLISGCAHAGYSKMAFKLYTDMRRRRLKVRHVTYTSLLTACANGLSPADGLRRLERLTDAMAERRYSMNAINYQALIRAYGRCGQLQRAFGTADELLQQGHPLTAELACVLLQACISDTQQGFRHALLVWHKLRSKQVTPSIYLYNLMLRAALDCGAGDTATFERAMQLILSAPPPGGAAVGTSAPSVTTERQAANFKSPAADVVAAERVQAGAAVESSQQGRMQAEAAVESQQGRMQAVLRAADAGEGAGQLPDLLAPRPHRGGLLQLRHLDTPPDRLAVLGGWTGLLRTMAADGVQPDIRTFSLLINTMPDSQRQQQSLLRTMDALGVQPDVGFFNQLVKRRASGGHRAAAKAAFSELQKRGIPPDIASFGCLAMTVRNMDDMTEFMDRLRAAQVRPNVELLSVLLNGAARAADLRRCLAVMEAFLEHRVSPDRRVLLKLEQLRLRLDTLLIDRERGGAVPAAARRPSFPEWVRRFRLRYSGWLAETEAETESHPHRQYRVRPLTALAEATAAQAEATGTQAEAAAALRQATRAQAEAAAALRKATEA